jgi:DNA-binding NarL/FixJ family response regulator
VIGRVSSPTFVGRREELGVLAAAISAAAAGSESVVLISGEPGIGKSRLISEFAARSMHPGPVVAALTRLELTAREIDVLSLIADGKTNRQIATELFISNRAPARTCRTS